MKICCVLLLVLIPAGLLAQSLPVNWVSNESQKNIDGRQVAVLADPDHHLTWTDIRRDSIAHRFRAATEANLNFGFSTDDYWARFDLRLTDSRVSHVLEIGFTNYTLIELYAVDSSGQVHISRVGDGINGPQRRQFPFYTFGLRLPPVRNQTIYLHLVSHYGQQYFPLTIWREKAYIEANTNIALLWGGFYGILLIVLLYHAVVFAFTRERSYLFLSGYLIWYIFYECCRGYNRLPHFDNAVLLDWIGRGGLTLIFPIGMVMFMLFYNHSLRLSQHFRWFPWVMTSLGCWCLYCIILVHVTPVGQLSTNRIAAWEGIPVGLTMIAVSTALWIKGVRIARFYALASIATAGGAILMMIQRAGFISSESLLVKFGFNIGSLLEFILLTLGLADRFREERAKQRKAELARIRQEARQEAEHQMALERERERMSVELHNDVGNSLMSARLMLNRLDAQQLPLPEQTLYQQLAVTMADTYDRLKDIAHGLNTQRFVRMGLAAELHKLVDVLNNTGQVQFGLSVPREADQLSIVLQATLYSFAAELTQNVLRHAQAEHANLRLSIEETSVRLSVRDDGKGPAAIQLGIGQGLRSIQQQAEQLGGHFTVKPFPEGGTSAIVILPLTG